MPSKDEILIALSPGSLRVGVVSDGQLSGVQRRVIDAAEWDAAWATGLRPFDEVLNQLLRASNAPRGGNVTLLYHGSQTFADVATLKVDRRMAEQAATLSLRETLPEGGRGWLTRVVPFDVPTHAVAGDGAEARRTQVLTAADRGASLDIVGLWLRRAGLKINGIVMSRGAQILDCVRLSKPQDEATVATLWVGEQLTVLTGWVAGRLSFVRAVDFGYAQLSDAIVRGARLANAELKMGREQADRLLFLSGIPSRGQVIDGNNNITAEQVLPLMQSVLQRYVIETKQTLRFGMSETDIGKAGLRIAGPGAAIPGLSNTLSAQFDIPVEFGTTPDTVKVLFEHEAGELVLGLFEGSQRMTLLPPSEIDRRSEKRLNMALRGGAIAAAACLGVFAAYHAAGAARVSSTIAGLQPKLNMIEEDRARAETAGRLKGEIDVLMRAVDQVVGDRPGWAATLNEFSQISGEHIELSEVVGGFASEGGGGAVVTLRGTAMADPKSNSDTLGEFLRRLAASPLVASAKVLSTQAADAESRTFTVAVQLKTVPVAVPRSADSVATAEGGQ